MRPTGTDAVLDEMSAATARDQLAACCASRRWIAGMLTSRPFGSAESVQRRSDDLLAGLSWADVVEALDAHPRIGRRVDGDGREAAWSRDEQRGTAAAPPEVAERLHAGNVAYEERFGIVFLVCATGLSAPEMLEALQRRLAHDPAEEQAVVREELRKIVRLRLGKLTA
jgi:2-oxo-4-hydroxy-4-carboxy-5-ureidoimidazoline decarboxylase